MFYSVKLCLKWGLTFVHYELWHFHTFIRSLFFIFYWKSFVSSDLLLSHFLLNLRHAILDLQNKWLLSTFGCKVLWSREGLHSHIKFIYKLVLNCKVVICNWESLLNRLFLIFCNSIKILLAYWVFVQNSISFWRRKFFDFDKLQSLQQITNCWCSVLNGFWMFHKRWENSTNV